MLFNAVTIWKWTYVVIDAKKRNGYSHSSVKINWHKDDKANTKFYESPHKKIKKIICNKKLEIIADAFDVSCNTAIEIRKITLCKPFPLTDSIWTLCALVNNIIFDCDVKYGCLYMTENKRLAFLLFLVFIFRLSVYPYVLFVLFIIFLS